MHIKNTAKSGFLLSLLICLIFSSLSIADTFKNIKTGEAFDGFATQKSRQGLTLVYNSDKKDFSPLNLDDYTVERNYNGRRDTVYVFSLTEPEILLSKVVSDEIANSIVQASDKGPMFILLEIDNPGGRGEYARIIAEAIKNTTNCTIVAYISGGSFGGVYSAATAIALASDKIYISNTATVGSMAPVVTSRTGISTVMEFRSTYNPKSLSLYKGYFASLAENHNRDRTVAMAMVDSSINVIEVRAEGGANGFIDMKNRKANDVVVKEWSREVPPSEAVTVTAQQTGDQVQTQIKIEDYSLTLTPEDALYLKMADEIVATIRDILADMNASQANLTSGGSIDRSIRRFQANKRTMGQLLASINYLESRVTELNFEIDQILEVNRQNPPTREYRRDELQDSRNLYPSDPVVINERVAPGQVDVSTRTGRRAVKQSEVIVESVMQDPTPLYLDLEIVLRDLVRDYQRALALATRYPGTLPEGITVNRLEDNLNSADVEYRDIRYRNDIMLMEQADQR